MRNSTKRLIILKSRIQDATETFADLSLEVDQIIQEENLNLEDENIEIPQAKLVKEDNKPSTVQTPSISAPSSKVKPEPPFQIGERVIITNNYKGLRETEGNVTGYTPTGKYTHIETDSGQIYRRAPHNLVNKS